MPKHYGIISSLAQGAAVLASVTLLPIPALGAGCGLKGDQAARSRPAAIISAARGNLSNALTIAGRDHFLRGLVRHLARDHAGAIAEFRTALDALPNPPSAGRNADEARIGFWSARALTALGDLPRAQRATAATSQAGASFYAQLAAGSSSDQTPKPQPRFLIIDQRTSLPLIWAVIDVESKFQTDAVSRAKALGLMQVMPSTAAAVIAKTGGNLDRDRLLSDPSYNVAIGSTYLGQLLSRYAGYLPLTLAAYNAGEGCTDLWLNAFGDPRRTIDPLTWLEAIPINETRHYVQAVLASYGTYVTHLAPKTQP